MDYRKYAWRYEHLPSVIITVIAGFFFWLFLNTPVQAITASVVFYLCGAYRERAARNTYHKKADR